MIENILGLDLGTKCGYCLDDEIAGTWDLRPRSHEDSGMRLVKFQDSLTEIIERGHVEMVAYEYAAFQPGGNGAAVVYGELLGALKLTCKRLGVRYVGIAVATVKKVATGKGNANKDAMVEAAAMRWPSFKGNSDDEADARWIREVALKEYGHADH